MIRLFDMRIDIFELFFYDGVLTVAEMLPFLLSSHPWQFSESLFNVNNG